MTTPLPDLPISELKGVGPATLKALARLAIEKHRDLLLHLPHRYEDRSRIVPFNELSPELEALVDGTIIDVEQVRGRVPALLVTITDGTSMLTLRFFRLYARQQNEFTPGRFIRAFGTVQFANRGLQMFHPDYTLSDTRLPSPQPELTPVYPATKGLTQATLRKLASAVCSLAWPDEEGWPWTALKRLHRPLSTDISRIESTRRELALDELTAYQLIMREQTRKRLAAMAIPLSRGPALGRQLMASLGFELTSAQRRVIGEVLTDLERPMPMLRLVQGDVGSGKTVIAAFAAIRAAENNCQTVIMAPTELLAEQHAVNFKRWLEPLGISVTLLTAAVKGATRTQCLKELANGKVAVAVGTHALFQSQVAFHRLALVIVDEQHRFGVHQRMALRDKGAAPHQLIMTATPIPRTLTMALYADMDVSKVDELPKGRQPITTRVMSQSQRAELLTWLRAVLGRGEQAFWVCTLIEANDEIPARAAEEANELLTTELPGVALGLLHGRMKPEDKAEVFARFKRGELSMLVATTVIEVGVDVPNATAIVVENPERLGLAQLHQLRGRVGRGNTPSHCVLLHSGNLSETARARLRAMRDSQDGFYLAERDLELRGPGEVLGTRQTGAAAFRLAVLDHDSDLLAEAAQRSLRLFESKPQTARRLLEAWSPGSGISFPI